MSVEINNTPDNVEPAGPSMRLNQAGGRRGGSRGGQSRLGRSSRERQMAIQREQQQISARDPDMVALRQRMDERSTDKTYRSGQVSVIGQQEAPPLYRPVNQLDERNTDRIYRDALVRPPTKQQIEQQARDAADPRRRRQRQHDFVPLPAIPTVRPQVQGRATKFTLLKPEEVRAVALDAASAASQGLAVSIVVAPALSLRLNTVLDGLMTRQLVSEEARYGINILVAETSAVAPPEATKAKKSLDDHFGRPEDLLRSQPAAQEPGDLDIASFLSGGVDDEEGIPEGPPATLVDDGDDGDDTLSPGADFLSPPEKEPVAQNPAPAPVAAAPVAKAAKGKKRRDK